MKIDLKKRKYASEDVGYYSYYDYADASTSVSTANNMYHCLVVGSLYADATYLLPQGNVSLLHYI